MISGAFLSVLFRPARFVFVLGRETTGKWSSIKPVAITLGADDA
jgi:hypothetical protein